MPTMSYAEWYRQEQERLRRQGIQSSPTGIYYKPPYVNTPTSFQQIGGNLLNIGVEQGKQELATQAGNYLSGASQAGGATASTIPAGAAIPSGYVGIGTAASGGTMIAPASSTGAAIPTTTGATSSSIGSTLGTVGGGIGALLGGYNLSRDIVGRRGATAGAQSGATTGAGIGTMLLPGVGTLVGAGIGAVAGAALGKLFGKRQKNLEKDRWKQLKDYGFNVPKPEWVDTKDAALKAQDKTLANDFVGYNEKGQWVNNKFANSGKDADLRAQDIYEFADNYETFGKPYQVLSTEKKQQIMDIALQNNLVREHKGTVDINWTPETLQQAQDILTQDKAVQEYLANQKPVYQYDTSYNYFTSKPPAPAPAPRKK